MTCPLPSLSDRQFGYQFGAHLLKNRPSQWHPPPVVELQDGCDHIASPCVRQWSRTNRGSEPPLHMVPHFPATWSRYCDASRGSGVAAARQLCKSGARRIASSRSGDPGEFFHVRRTGTRRFAQYDSGNAQPRYPAPLRPVHSVGHTFLHLPESYFRPLSAAGCTNLRSATADAESRNAVVRCSELVASP